MSDGASILDDIGAALAPSGLVTRGGFVFDEDYSLPATMTGSGFRSVVLVGHFGSSPWPHFSRWRQNHPGVSDPLDQWSKDILTSIGTQLGAVAVFPSDKPYLPFQQWAMRAEALRPSPLGMLIHPIYGLWHAYRGALLFDRVVDFPRAERAGHPCDTCRERPCLSTCPVGAFKDDRYDVVACRIHLSVDLGHACIEGGCVARRACPIGQQHAYVSPQMQFHMAAFARG